MKNKIILRDLAWITPVSLLIGALLSGLDGGTWWIGWLGYSLIGILGLSAVTATWRWAGTPRTLGLILLAALLLRLSLAVALTEILPIYGHTSEVDQGGYVFRDAYNRDTQAWTLASSPDSLFRAFDKKYSTDQYGGLLFLYSVLYRGLSPDHHRPWLGVLLGLLTSVMGVAITWKVAWRLGGETLAKPAAWVYALYPEAILLAASEMREPFLMTFIAMAFWGVLEIQGENSRKSWLWVAGGLAGLLVFNPAVAIFALIGMSGWLLLRSGRSRISWRVVLVIIGVTALALILMWMGVARGILAGGSLPKVLSNWMQLSAYWDVYFIQQSSGWIQSVFKVLPVPLHMPFMIGYGIAQPVLPAAIADPTAWPWKVIAIGRALGWYLLIPFLIGYLFQLWKVTDRSERRVWLWLWFITFIWIVVSSYRAGGDQWDNPRYRVIFLIWQVLLGASAWTWWRKGHNPWQGRILAVEGVFLALFGYWYAARYTNWRAGQVHVFVILGLILVISCAIMLGGWLWDSRKKPRQRS
jgi:hypothetical protein